MTRQMMKEEIYVTMSTKCKSKRIDGTKHYIKERGETLTRLCRG